MKGLRTVRRTTLAVVLGIALSQAAAADGGPAGGAADVRAEPTRARRVYDASVLRPIAFVNLLGAAAVYPVAYPVALVTGGTGTVRRYCWDVPAERLFRRPLGRL